MKLYIKSLEFILCIRQAYKLSQNTKDLTFLVEMRYIQKKVLTLLLNSGIPLPIDEISLQKQLGNWCRACSNSWQLCLFRYFHRSHIFLWPHLKIDKQIVSRGAWKLFSKPRPDSENHLLIPGARCPPPSLLPPW